MRVRTPTHCNTKSLARLIVPTWRRFHDRTRPAAGCLSMSRELRALERGTVGKGADRAAMR
ncbi:MAG: hypothetical protein WAS21_13770, partial [Geminicoccaceae bacterium]